MTPSNEDLEQWEADANIVFDGVIMHPSDAIHPARVIELIAEVRRLRQHSQEVWHKFNKDDEKSHPPQRGAFYWVSMTHVNGERLCFRAMWEGSYKDTWYPFDHWMPITTPEPPKEES